MLDYFLIASLLTLLTHGYFALRLLPALPVSSRARRLTRALCVVNILLLPAALVFTLSAAPWTARWSVPLARLAFADVGFCILLSAGLGVVDLIWAGRFLLTRWRKHQRRADYVYQEQRRRLLLGSVNLAVGGVAGAATAVGYGLAVAAPEVCHVRVPCSQAPRNWATRGLRIAQISDLHVGPTIRRDYVEKVVTAVNALVPDLIVITGDLVDGFVTQLRDQVQPLQHLKARYGVYFVTGNHEYFYRAPEWITELTALGLHVLADQSHVIVHEGVRVLLVGINDPNALPPEAPSQQLQLAQLLLASPAAELRVLLAHRPGDVVATAKQGIDLQLSGHLHGGQFFPLTLLVRWFEPFVAGLYRVGALWLYVNRGTGYWGPPNRLGARQELTLLELTCTSPE